VLAVVVRNPRTLGSLVCDLIAVWGYGAGGVAGVLHHVSGAHHRHELGMHAVHRQHLVCLERRGCSGEQLADHIRVEHQASARPHEASDEDACGLGHAQGRQLCDGLAQYRLAAEVQGRRSSDPLRLVTHTAVESTVAVAILPAELRRAVADPHGQVAGRDHGVRCITESRVLYAVGTL
jgi:hypothetical protein